MNLFDQILNQGKLGTPGQFSGGTSFGSINTQDFQSKLPEVNKKVQAEQNLLAKGYTQQEINFLKIQKDKGIDPAQSLAFIQQKRQEAQKASQFQLPTSQGFQMHETIPGSATAESLKMKINPINSVGDVPQAVGKTIFNALPSAYQTGAWLFNLGSTAVQEGVKGAMKGDLLAGPKAIYNTAVQGAVNPTLAGVQSSASEVGKAYNQGGILPAVNKGLDIATKFAGENPTIVGPMVKSIIKPVENLGKVTKLEPTVSNVISKIPNPTGIITAPVKAIYNQAKVLVGKPNEIQGIQQAIKPYQTVKNGRTQDVVTKEISLANSLIRESGTKPTDLASYKDAVKTQMQNVGSEINRLTGQDLSIDLSDTAGKIREMANSSTIQTLDPSGGKALTDIADRLQKGRISATDAEFMNQYINDQLKNPLSGASETYKRGLQILVGDIRTKLDTAISDIPGQFAQIKKTYGSLRNIYGDVAKREIVYNRANPEGLISSVGKIEGAGNIMGGVVQIITGHYPEGAVSIGKGMTAYKVAQFIKERNDSNSLIKRVFEQNGKKSIIPNIPNKLKNDNLNNPNNPIVSNTSGITNSKQKVVTPKSFGKAYQEKINAEIKAGVPLGRLSTGQEFSKTIVKTPYTTPKPKESVVVPKKTKPSPITKKSIIKPNSSTNEQQVSKPKSNSTTTNMFGETIPKPSQKNGGFIKIPEIGKKTPVKNPLVEEARKTEYKKNIDKLIDIAKKQYENASGNTKYARLQDAKRQFMKDLESNSGIEINNGGDKELSRLGFNPDKAMYIHSFYPKYVKGTGIVKDDFLSLLKQEYSRKNNNYDIFTTSSFSKDGADFFDKLVKEGYLERKSNTVSQYDEFPNLGIPDPVKKYDVGVRSWMNIFKITDKIKDFNPKIDKEKLFDEAIRGKIIGKPAIYKMFGL